MAILTEIQEEHQEAEKAYDVFLSFRGIDTRLNFTDYLYHALVNENINTFLDEQNVETGEELKPELTRAIKSSRASIIVLSKNYASSTWCLDELVLILEQKRKSSKYIVVPIFYHVEPTHVRKQESSYGEALFIHRQRMEAEPDREKKSQAARKLESWTDALREVAGLLGRDINGRREMVFIEEIVKDISHRLGIHMRSNIPRLIGMDTHIDTIRSWLKEGSSDTAEIITIWGMAGIGKTSLAKYIYMLHHQDFKRSSFVEEIESKFEHVSSDLQKKLLEDILKKTVREERLFKTYTSKIETALSEKETVLLVLDGVNDSSQVEVLVGRARFHPGSKIIITTKDSSITKKCALFRKEFFKHTELALCGLSDAESLKLFCWHAFGSYDPEEGYEELATRASKYCGGHPLALEVLGRSLFAEDVGAWNHTFTKLESTKFHADVNKVLQVSFDSLPSEDCKVLFKHIACFFVGNDKDVTQTILTHCGLDAPHWIKKLIQRCLLTIDAGNELKMHQLIQDMGRDVVRQESPRKPWKRSLVWDHAESLSILQEDKGTTNIRGLFLDMKMIEKKSLRGISSVTDHEFQNHDLNMKFGVSLSVRALELSSSSWENIELSSNALRKMENLVLLQLPALERLILRRCENLTHVCESIGGCENLVHLDMSYCIKLKNLPISICMLNNIRILSLDGCIGASEFEKKTKHMKLLKVLNKDSVSTNSHTSSYSIARFLPNSQKYFAFSLLPSLVTLSLASNNLSDESFPMDFSSMSMLKNLYLDNNPIDSMPDCVRSLNRLEVLSVIGCSTLKSVLHPPRMIKHLFTQGCLSLDKITFHQEVSASPIVLYSQAASLTEIQGIIKLQALAQTDNKVLLSLGWTNLHHLKELKMRIWNGLLWSKPKKLLIHMFYEFGIFSTCFPGKDVPYWIAHRSNGSSISITMSSPSINKKIEGINICSVHTFLGLWMFSHYRLKVWNRTKNRTWIYYGYVSAIREDDEGMVWLSHWMFRKNELESGDEVCVTISDEPGVMVTQCGISVVYSDEDKDDIDPLSYYKSWKHIIGGDLKTFQLTSGDYFLINGRVSLPHYAFNEIFQLEVTQKLIGYIGQYKTIHNTILITESSRKTESLKTESLKTESSSLKTESLKTESSSLKTESSLSLHSSPSTRVPWQNTQSWLRPSSAVCVFMVLCVGVLVKYIYG